MSRFRWLMAALVLGLWGSAPVLAQAPGLSTFGLSLVFGKEEAKAPAALSLRPLPGINIDLTTGFPLPTLVSFEPTRKVAVPELLPPPRTVADAEAVPVGSDVEEESSGEELPVEEILRGVGNSRCPDRCPESCPAETGALVRDCLTYWKLMWGRGDFARAQELAEIALRLDPDNLAAQHALTVARIVNSLNKMGIAGIHILGEESPAAMDGSALQPDYAAPCVEVGVGAAKGATGTCGVFPAVVAACCKEGCPSTGSASAACSDIACCAADGRPVANRSGRRAAAPCACAKPTTCPCCGKSCSCAPDRPVPAAAKKCGCGKDCGCCACNRPVAVPPCPCAIVGWGIAPHQVRFPQGMPGVPCPVMPEMQVIEWTPVAGPESFPRPQLTPVPGFPGLAITMPPGAKSMKVPLPPPPPGMPPLDVVNRGMPFPPPMPYRDQPVPAFHPPVRTTSFAQTASSGTAPQRRVRFQTPEMELSCDRLATRDGDVLVAEGNVEVTSRRGGRLCRIQAERVSIHLRDGSFLVESGR